MDNKNPKPRVIKDYDKLDSAIQERIKLEYPYGFSDNLITFTGKNGGLVSALPFETDDRYYMVRMSKSEAVQIIEDDDDFDADGILKTGIKEELEVKHNDDDDIVDDIAEENEDEEDDEGNDDGLADLI